MKINEITKQSNQLDEGILAKLFSPVVGKLAKFVKGKPKTAQERKFARDLDTVASYASKKLSSAKKFMTTIGTWGLKGSMLYSVYTPLDDYLKNVEYGQQQVEQGRWTEEQFKQFEQSEMAALTGKWAEAFLANKLTKLGFNNVVRPVLTLGGQWKALSGLVDGMSLAGQAAMLHWIASPEGAKHVANWLAYQIDIPVIGSISAGDVAGAAGELAKKAILAAATNAAKMISDKPADPTATTTSPEKPATTADPNSTTTATDKPVDPAATANTQTPEKPVDKKPAVDFSNGDWEFHRPGFLRNTKTGEIKRGEA